MAAGCAAPRLLSMKIREAMTTDVTTVPADLPVRAVAAMLIERRISGAPVVDRRQHVVGVVSECDLVGFLADPTGEVARWPRLRWRRRRSPTARDVMSTPAVTIGPRRSVAHAATVMIARDIGRLPVVEDGRLVGILTRADLVREFTRDDASIEAEIWDVVLRTVFVNPRHVRVQVEGGAVELTGEVETRGKARRLVQYVERVPGVTSVRSHLTWRLKDGPPRGVPPARRT
jgi:CBS domain-containing protein